MEESLLGLGVAIILLVITEILATFKAKRKDINTNTITNVEMKTDVSYIRKNMDKALEKIDKHECKITEIEQSTKFAHKRIDKQDIEIDKLKERRNDNG